MSVSKKTQIGTVDLTPSWAEQVSACIAILDHSENEKARQTAREELRRMGRALDQLQAQPETKESGDEPQK